jgi:hypothetical protein
MIIKRVPISLDHNETLTLSTLKKKLLNFIYDEKKGG